MATNISYVLKHKSKFFDTFLNDLQTVSKEYQKRLKKVGILRVNCVFGLVVFIFFKPQTLTSSSLVAPRASMVFSISMEVSNKDELIFA